MNWLHFLIVAGIVLIVALTKWLKQTQLKKRIAPTLLRTPTGKSGQPHGETLRQKFDSMADAQEVLNWIAAKERRFWDEWPRDSGGYNLTLLAVEQSKHGGKLVHNLKCLKDKWQYPTKFHDRYGLDRVLQDPPD